MSPLDDAAHDVSQELSDLVGAGGDPAAAADAIDRMVRKRIAEPPMVPASGEPVFWTTCRAEGCATPALSFRGHCAEHGGEAATITGAPSGRLFLREEFAMAALTGILANPNVQPDLDKGVNVRVALDYADLMMEARGRWDALTRVSMLYFEGGAKEEGSC